MSMISGDEPNCTDLMSYRIKNNASMLHSEIRSLEAYWQALRAGRPCPYRAEVDPRDIQSRIGHLFILEDLGLGNVRFRIAGTTLTELFGMELRGMPIRTIMEMRARQSLAELISETLAEPGVGYARLRRSSGAREVWELILLPLKSDQGRIDRVIGALHCLQPTEAGDSRDAPLRFVVEDMSIMPVDVTRTSDAIPECEAAGFAEPASSFKGSAEEVESAGHLTAIEGGKSADQADAPEAKLEPSPARKRPTLRIISNDD